MYVNQEKGEAALDNEWGTPETIAIGVHLDLPIYFIADQWAVTKFGLEHMTNPDWWVPKREVDDDWSYMEHKQPRISGGFFEALEWAREHRPRGFGRKRVIKKGKTLRRVRRRAA